MGSTPTGGDPADFTSREIEDLEREEREEDFTPIDRVPWFLRRKRDLSPLERRAVLEQLFSEGPDFVPSLWRHFTLMALSAAIAAFGMLNDSAAVVIGAMLVAPLMTPLIGYSAATVMGWPARQLQTVVIVAASSALAIGIAALIEIVQEGDESVIPAEVLSRTEPNLLDLGIAIAAGAAGAYVTVRTKAGGALPGVAIAVALVPPLTAAGILYGRGETGLGNGALLLFFTNLAAIVLAAMIVLLGTGFIPRARAARINTRLRLGLAIAVLAVIGVTLPLASYTAREISNADRRQQLTSGIEEWLGGRDVEIQDVQLDERSSDGWELALRLVGPDRPPAAQPLAESIAERIGRPGTVVVDFVKEERETARAERRGP